MVFLFQITKDVVYAQRVVVYFENKRPANNGEIVVFCKQTSGHVSSPKKSCDVLRNKGVGSLWKKKVVYVGARRWCCFF